MSDQALVTSRSVLQIRRHHPGGRSLRAWDAADEQLIEEALTRLVPGQRIVVMDDSHGALSLGLHSLAPRVLADSAGLADALSVNAQANKLPVPELNSWCDQTLWHPRGGGGLEAATLDAVIFKVPRQLDYLEMLLRWANSRLKPGGLLLTGGMIKHLPSRSVRLYQKLVETEQVLPAKKKARLVACHPGTDALEHWNGLWRGYRLPSGLNLQALPAVFGRETLDSGAGLLLPVIADAVRDLSPGIRVLDLACGNGVLGLSALQVNSGLALTFADISSQAIVSVSRNLEQLQTAETSPDAGFFHSDGVPAGAGKFDLVLLNPPFHEGGAVGDHIALRLFADVAASLAPGGRMLMVGNRHLGYHQSLQRSFSSVRQLAADPRFVVFEASA
ncbi:methyltransferase [uncultured Marinobacter sp.]|uniref:class I SAM-dependent methyltransferase n=1 Tax=uncultured Marinobacter sp. TaxID=187379 RepID=UPI0030D87F27